MRVDLIEKNDKEEVVKCPKDGKKYEVPYCRKECNYFKGYKTVDDQRKVLCKYSK